MKYLRFLHQKALPLQGELLEQVKKWQLCVLFNHNWKLYAYWS